MSGYVYAIGIESTTHIKIGRAASPKARLAALQIGLPFKIELLYSLRVEHPSAVERALHEMLEDSRVWGEWFEMPETPLTVLFDKAVQQAESQSIAEEIMDEASIGKTMQRLLEEKGWSKQTLCKRAGLHYQQVYKVLSGETPDPRLSTLIRLAKAFDLPLGFLQDVEEPQYELREDGKKLKKPKRTQARKE